MYKIAFVALALFACSKSSSEKKPDKQPTADKPAADKPAAKSPADLFTGTKPALPEPVAKLSYGMPEADAKAAAPDVFAAKYGYEVPGYDNVKINVQIEKGRVYQTRMEIKKDIEEVKGWITPKWGEPRATKNSIGSPEYLWEAPDVGLRVKLEKSATNSMVRYDPVMSIEQVLGSDPKMFGVEKIPLMGATEEALMKAYELNSPLKRDEDPNSIQFSFPRIAGVDFGPNLSVRLKDGKVTGYVLSIPSTFNDKIAPRLEAMFGPGKPETVTNLYIDYKGPPKVKAQLHKDTGFSSTIWVADYKKQ
jgi:hypothetical protein